MLPADVDDFRILAQQRLPSFLFDFIAGGSASEQTLRENVAAWARVRLRQHVLRDVSRLNLQSELLGQPASMPLALAPVGLGGLTRRRGEVQAALAAQDAGVPFTLCTPSLCSLEEVHAATRAPFWFQLYMLRDRGVVRELLARARAVQCPTLLFTVDLARVGVRRSDIRHGMTQPPSVRTALARLTDVVGHPRWLWDVPLRGGPLVFGNLAEYVPKARKIESFRAWVDAQFDPSVTWKDIEWLRQEWDGQLVIKGVLEVDDACMAARIGAEGVVVSNHGGRQLDATEASADALPRIAEALAALDGPRRSVLVDGGIRHGHDLIKARVLGADGVLIGRPWAYALAADGRAGVSEMLRLMQAEASSALGLMGHTDVRQAARDWLLPQRSAVAPGL